MGVRKRTRGWKKASASDIAVIGLACRFPGAENYSQYWENLRRGAVTVSEVPRRRWDWREYWGDPESGENKTNSRWGGFLTDVDAFDSHFFNMSAREVEVVDPQQRIMLEVAWSCLEDACIPAAHLAGKRVGVFIGAFNYDYKEIHERNLSPIEAYQSTGMSPAVIANRISHFFNFNGPSVALDTACSSSLHALHLAVQSLWTGECHLAMAGGVNLLLTPTRHIAFSKAGLMSPTGSCKSFDDKADGYVRGEGAGIVLLKPLAQAIEDSDNIVGVIKGTAVNHSGKTHTLTYPNHEAQAAVIRDAVERSGVPMHSISYIEAHGTGTPKGDPIEIAGLIDAFRVAGKTTAKPFCGIGSVKANIGHLESAAGIAGLIKVLLAMRHQELPGLALFEKLNKKMSLENTPFFIVDRLKEWKLLKREGKRFPRRAGVSSFGFGGTNAHVIVEEFVSRIRRRSKLKRGDSCLIALSAKSQEALQSSREVLASWLESNAGVDLADVSACLLRGRTHFKYRAAWVVGDVASLIQQLRKNAEISPEADSMDIKQRTKRLLEKYDRYAIRERARHTRQGRFAREQQRKLEELRDAYLKGSDFDWALVFDHKPFVKLALPTYPFVRDRHWLPDMAIDEFQSLAEKPPTGFGLQDISSAKQTCYKVSLCKTDDCLANHVIDGRNILPASAYFELASQVILRKSGIAGDAAGFPLIRFEDFCWLVPVAVDDDPQVLKIGLVPRDAAKFECDFCVGESTRDPDASVTISLHAAPQRPPFIDLATIRKSRDLIRLDVAHFYASQAELGLDYGSAHRGICEAYASGDDVLAKIELSADCSVTSSGYILPPALLDSALQAALMLAWRKNSSTRFVAVSAQRVDVYNPCPASIWVLARPVRHGSGTSEFDLAVMNEHGELICDIRGFTLQSVKSQGQKRISEKAQEVLGTQLLLPRWMPAELDLVPHLPAPDVRSGADSHAGAVLVVGGTDLQRASLLKIFPGARWIDTDHDITESLLVKALKRYAPIDRLVWVAPLAKPLAPGNQQMIRAQDAGVIACFRLIKALLHLGYGGRHLAWTIITQQAIAVNHADSIDPTHASVHGLVGAMAKEYPQWLVQVVDMPDVEELPPDSLLAVPSDAEVYALRNGIWYVQRLLPYRQTALPEQIYRRGGVYVVIGGARGIGKVWSREVIRKYGAQVVWIGRRAEEDEISASIRELAAHGPAPIYIAADATDLKSLTRACQSVKKRFGAIHGLVHSAMVLAPQPLSAMPESRFKTVLSSKVDSCVNLAHVFEPESLDFIVFFSSIDAFQKSANHSNYAAGCTFKDAFAQHLSRQWPCHVKTMNWGYWTSVGALADSETLRTWLSEKGIGSIEPEEGMEALDTLISGPAMQLALMKNTRPRAIERCQPGLQATGTVATQNVHLGVLAEKLITPSAELNAVRLAGGGLHLRDANSLLAKLLWKQLRQMNFFAARKVTVSDLGQQAGIVAGARRWLQQSAKFLAEYGYLKCNGFDYEVTGMPEEESCWNDWSKLVRQWQADSDKRAQVRLVDATLRALPSILRGELRATDVIFPDSSLDLVEGIYKNNRVSDYYNAVVADAVVALGSEWQATQRGGLRILEIGAGTGGTTSAVIQRLQASGTSVAEYCYTDVSRAFLLHGETAYAAKAPWLTCKLFNVELPLEQQGFALAGYDIVIATNVLHATKTIRQTIRNAKALLRCGGMLLLNELSNASLFSHLTFGLLDGWWLYTDEELRIEGSPGLNSIAWKAVLLESGFREVVFPNEASHELGQQIVMAACDGIAVQPRSESASAARVVFEKHAVVRVQEQAENISSDRRQVIKEALARQLAQALRIREEEIDSNTPFADYGLDSITGVQLVRALNRELGTELKTTALFDHSTLAALAEHILEAHGGNRAVSSSKQSGTVSGQPVISSSEMRESVKAAIEDQLSQALKIRQGEIDPNAPFADYGLDSITGVHLVRALNRELGAELKTTALFDHSTVAALTAHIFESYGDKLKAPAAAKAPEFPEQDHGKHSQGLPIPVTASPLKIQSAAMVHGSEAAKAEPIAIVGMSGRFARANSIESLWQHIANGEDLVEPVTRWDLKRSFAAELPPGGRYCDRGGLLHDIDKFDPLFFNISTLEARYMDPQQRLFLLECWKALEDAGYAGARTSGRSCGVYVGCSKGDYTRLFSSAPPAQAFWGNAGSVVPARIAYYLDLQGPAIAVDTACSSSLAAIHLACQGLRAGEVEVALAGGVFVQSTPEFYVLANRAGMLSPTGRCHTFDDRADGFVPGEGIGVIVLKRLADALACGDQIHGVIRGSGLNQDGTTNGITAPSARSQERLECSVYDAFGIDPAEIQLVEAHGTGTRLGDPIEYEALTRAFRRYTVKRAYCALGSIKTNIGHATTAAGIAGVLKVLMALKHRQLPPSLHFESGNANIDFANSPFYVNTRLQPWSVAAGERRRAVVSSFGFSGTNAHIVLEEAEVVSRKPRADAGYLIVLSARTSEQLKKQAERLLLFLASHPDADCGDIAYTLLTGRKHFNQRLALVAEDTEALRRILQGWLAGERQGMVFAANLDKNAVKPLPSIVREGEDSIAQCAAYRRNLKALTRVAELYVQDYPLQYERLFSAGEFCRLSLPAYPFAEERYWIDSADEGVTVAPQLKALSGSTQAMPPTLNHLPKGSASAVNSLLLAKQVWQQSELGCSNPVRMFARRIAILCGCEVQIPGVEVICWRLQGLSRPEEYRALALRVLSELQALLQGHPVAPVLIQLVIAAGSSDFQFDGLAGMFKTATLENPRVLGQVIEFDTDPDANALVRVLDQEASFAESAHIKYESGKRLLPKWKEISLSPASAPWKDHGVYLITGGLGGLGIAFASEIASKISAATLFLVGRSPLNEAGKRKILALHDQGVHVSYHVADVAKPIAVEALIAEIVRDFGALHGVIHAAGTIRDSFVFKKTREELGEVFAAKVFGAEILDEATRHLPLDFFLLCSSITAELGNAGQADYAAANAYMDRFARKRNRLVMRGERSGRSLSINWPLWKDGGMQLSEYAAKELQRKFGMSPMTTANGMTAFYAALASAEARMFVMEGEPDKMRAVLLENSKSEQFPEIRNRADQNGHEDTLNHFVDDYVIESVAHVLQVGPATLNREMELQEIGLDEQALRQVFTHLNESLPMRSVNGDFFKQTTLRSLIQLVREVANPEREASVRHRSSTIKAGMGEKEREGARLHSRELVKSAIARVTEIDAVHLDVSADFSSYGLDSIMIMEITEELEKSFGPLSKTLFFEHGNICQLADYLSQLGVGSADSISNASWPDFGTRSNPQQQGVLSQTALQAEIAEQDDESAASDIAIVGVSGRYAQARNLEEFWENLREGRDCITEVPKNRWNHNLYFDKDQKKAGKTYTCWGGFIDGVDEFDPQFFNILPRRAEIMEPQERLFLQCAYETLQDAGYTPQSLARNAAEMHGGNVGVFVGVSYEEYQLYAAQAAVHGRAMSVSASAASIANRVSYFCNLQGPSMTVDTMCSSSLSAIHLACQSILHGECDAAIAGGVNVSIHPAKFLMLSQEKLASTHGRCKSFGSGGDGYAPGEGVGAVLLKRLRQAEADGDHIYGVIKATAMNHGGKTYGYWVPNPNAQAAVIAEAIRKAGIDPRTVTYVEAQGTGTALGDPIEIAGLNKAFGAGLGQYCAVGSVKSNIGNCESAAGIAGVTKVLLQMQHGQLTPSLHADVLNPNIDFGQTAFFVQQRLEEWRRPCFAKHGIQHEYPRRAGVSSFGAGGSNVHVVMEEYLDRCQKDVQADVKSAGPALIVLSARKETQLIEVAARLLRAQQQGQYRDVDLESIAYTLQVGREAMSARLAMVVQDVADLGQKLESFIDGNTNQPHVYCGQVAASGDVSPLAPQGSGHADDYDELARLWVAGRSMDWLVLYRNRSVRRVSLPTYPFERQRYWLPQTAINADDQTVTPKQMQCPEEEDAIVLAAAAPSGS